jgi:hypothetical protein
MKLKQFTYGISIIASALLLTTGCNKKANSTPPEADKEFSSAVDAQWAEETVNDIVLMCAQSSENGSMLFYSHNPALNGASITNTVTLLRDTIQAVRKVTITFNNAVCYDGKRRNGSIVCDYSTSNVSMGANYFRQAGYRAIISLNNFTVDGWKITNVSGSNIVIENKAPAAYIPSNTILSWDIIGDLKFRNTALNSLDSMTWKSSRRMILANSTSSAIVTSTAAPIKWALAQVEWCGKNTMDETVVTGKTIKGDEYITSIKDDKDFRFMKSMTCAPNGQSPLNGVNSPNIPFLSQRHPFTKGMMKFTLLPKKDSPRAVDIGDGTCDSKATVTIDGITYGLDLKN